MKKIKKLVLNFLKDKKKLKLIPLTLVWMFWLFFLAQWVVNSISSDILSASSTEETEVLWKWEVLLNFLNEIRSWNEQFFESYDLRYYPFDEIVEEEVIEFTNNTVKLKFYANTTWDSLHEYFYTLNFEDWVLVSVVEWNYN